MSQPWQENTRATGNINILLLGQTGVGKTTFINAFANYLVYNSLDEAIDGKLQSMIPAWFVFIDKNTFEEKTITIGTPDRSEKKGTVGQSRTRECRSFVFKINNRKLRLIDTPGIGDTEGVLQDEKNFEDILAYIGQFEYLNGICILLKPNEERLHILFRFCVKELLRHLHVHAKENIMFIFTNARSTNFQPGPSAPLLRELLRSLKDQFNVEVPFSRDNSFFFDNEAFRFLASCKNGIEFDALEKQNYCRSWDYTITEFSRLIYRIMKCHKHATRETLSLNEAQQLIRKLSRPVGEIATLIQENIQLAQQHKHKVVSKRTSTPQILPQKDAETVPLGFPRTVCTNDKCTKVIMIEGLEKVDYASHCHPHCHLTGVEQETIGNEKLKDCSAMDKTSRICTQCGCGWKEHMHVTYEFRKFMRNIDMNSSNKAQSLAETIEQRIKDLRAEQEAIIKVCTQLSQFLRVNALNPVNDDILDYIQHFIREEQTKRNAGVQNDGVIAGLQKLLVDYQHEMNIVQQGMRIGQTTLSTNSTDSTKIVKPEEVFLLVGTLYHLPINGAKIRAQVNELKGVQLKFSRNNEQTVDLLQQTAFPILKSQYISNQIIQKTTVVVPIEILKNYQYDIDIQKTRKLYETTGKQIYFGRWMSKNTEPIIIVEISEEIAQRTAHFYRELNGHNHIIYTLGYVENSLNLTILIQEYAKFGNLHDLLINNQINVSQSIMIEIYTQITDAMSYIASKSIVHGDLGCRNILVFQMDSSEPKKNLVKLTDFDSARSIDRECTEENPIIIPIRYCAPEILRLNDQSNYSEKSDVYSMGVLMWEAQSNGEIPYSLIADDMIVQRMKLNNEKLIRPSICYDQLWKLMVDCWHNNPQERPTFELIKKQLSIINASEAPDFRYSAAVSQ